MLIDFVSTDGTMDSSRSGSDSMVGWLSGSVAGCINGVCAYVLFGRFLFSLSSFSSFAATVGVPLQFLLFRDCRFDYWISGNLGPTLDAKNDVTVSTVVSRFRENCVFVLFVIRSCNVAILDRWRRK